MWERILSAIEVSDNELVNFYLNTEAALVYEQNARSETLLHYAARYSDAGTINEFLIRGARPDVADDFDWTPLHEACRSGNEDAVSLFIKTGINLNFVNQRHESPLHVAARHNFPRITARLVEAGAEKNLQNAEGNTPLQLALVNGHVGIVDVLLTAGADLLLSNCADPAQKDNGGNTFTDIARIFHNETFLLLINVRLQQESTRPDESCDDTITRKRSAILQKYINEGSPAPKSKVRKNFLNAFLRFFFKRKTFSSISDAFWLLESAAWFGLFPYLLFLIWKGIECAAVPPVLHFSASPWSQISGIFAQNLANWLLIFGFSCLLVHSESDKASVLHFFNNLREAVFFRVTHFALIAAYFCRNLTLGPAILSEFAIFWLGFFALYAVSYSIWWFDTHSIPQNRSEELQQNPPTSEEAVVIENRYQNVLSYLFEFSSQSEKP
ncbi:hypothetical protein MASR1M12_18410 [Erysipelotrichia bacterium]